MIVCYYRTNTFGNFYYLVFEPHELLKNPPGSAGGDVSWWLVPGTCVEDSEA